MNEVNRRVKTDSVRKGWSEKSPLENVHRVGRQEEEEQATEWSSKEGQGGSPGYNCTKLRF